MTVDAQYLEEAVQLIMQPRQAFYCAPNNNWRVDGLKSCSSALLQWCCTCRPCFLSALKFALPRPSIACHICAPSVKSACHRSIKQIFSVGTFSCEILTNAVCHSANPTFKSSGGSLTLVLQTKSFCICVSSGSFGLKAASSCWPLSCLIFRRGRNRRNESWGEAPASTRPR